jgi:hypothetical protein
MNRKAIVLTVSNAALYLALCALVGTGLLLELRMDEEDGAPRLLGMGRDDWSELHFAVALTFVGLALVHSALNWAWIKTALRQRKSAFVVVGVGAAFVAVLLLWPADHRAAYDGPEPIRHQTSHD